MHELFFILIGIMLPFLGTTAGAVMVFFLHNNSNSKMQKIFLGFSAGLMLAASVWSLIIPSIELSENLKYLSWLPAAAGLCIGCVFFIFVDYFFDKRSKGNISKETQMLVLAITLHNFPEGMAVGAAFAGILYGNSVLTYSAAFALAVGIAIQNFPEGAAVSLPMLGEGKTKIKAFMYGVLSGIVEPISAFFTILLSNFINTILPFLLAFAAGCMIYVVIEEIIPKIQDKKSNLGILGVFLGFVIMMVLDVMLR